MTGLVAAASAVVLVLGACGGDDGDETPAPGGGTTAAASEIKVGLAYDIGGRGDKSFNDSAAEGLDKASDEFGVEATELEAAEGETDAQKEERLRQLADAGNNPIIAVGFAYATALAAVAPEYPDVSFAIIDDATLVDEPNVASLTFAEEQGSFLVGAIAAQASKTNNIGFVGGVETPLIHKFQAGYEAGAKAVKPDIQIQVTYLTQPPDFTGFNDPAKGQTAAAGMYDSGADVVYHAAGGSGGGVFTAAKAGGKLAIGVDADQYLGAAPDVQPVILTSMLKEVDVAVYDMIKSSVDGKPLTGAKVYDLEAGGVGFSTSNSIVAPFTATAEDYEKKIISGEIVVPTEVGG
ncbi:BMP family ABC transporter substrate-binding protein [Frankia sp. CNm7]|uniref:BMP family ABC transporter substrate-binding protein n=1 Tax=Frankia nepalensis TaxID=1836974 RepID=A0A937RPP4_9ACTN|nr:BMP family ABC transporter substrate-binding protein [Frankia nepalensis]MBL7500177.1 BMP family ABC transporter substrate-binding protein [Frankia nepalensis]MBL7512409.1 BMP family ABC transporter substrate-binding protein [Frankia nepalensis]MBL7518114.1 BMP family ABC transporter substrate-binding protein [Frankia nepalensis]MBL7632725.1 BMP family ABC transporter substrate-binding protein [Frankia nepalensis]